MAKQSNDSIPAGWFMAGFSNPARLPLPPRIQDIAAKAESKCGETIEQYIQRLRSMGPPSRAPQRCVTCGALETEANDTIAGGRICVCGSRSFG